MPGAGAVFAGGASSRNGRTTVLRARPVAGSMSSSAGGLRGKTCGPWGGGIGPTTRARVVVLVGASSENAGETKTARARRRIALKRDIGKGGTGSDAPHAQGARGAALEPGLYVVATPIGNLGDITHRALDTLARASWIAAEDTRVTRALLSHFGIGARLLAVHEHNEAAAAERVCRAIAAGEAVALVSDAGTPGVSDPGRMVVQKARAAGLPVVPIPGPSALTAAICASGLDFEGIVFAGFLPAKGAERRERLAALAAGPWAIALFESPHRVARTLADLHESCGERDVVIARELTKRFESTVRLPLSGARAWIEADETRRRGELVLLVEGRPVERRPALDPRAVLEKLLAELPLKQAVALAVALTGARRNVLYGLALELQRRMR